MKSISEKQIKKIYQLIQDIVSYNTTEIFMSCDTTEDFDNYKIIVTVEDMRTLFDILNIKTITKKTTVEVAKTNTCGEYLHDIIKDIL